MAAKRKLATVRAAQVETTVVVVACPCESRLASTNAASLATLTENQLANLTRIKEEIDKLGFPGARVAVFKSFAPLAQEYAKHIAIHLNVDSVECAGHADDICECVEDRVGEADLVIIVESVDDALEVVHIMEKHTGRECDIPKKVGTSKLFIIPTPT